MLNVQTAAVFHSGRSLFLKNMSSSSEQSRQQPTLKRYTYSKEYSGSQQPTVDLTSPLRRGNFRCFSEQG